MHERTIEVRMKTSVKLRASAVCLGNSRNNSRVRELNVVIDEPQAWSGANPSPCPTDAARAVLLNVLI